MKIRSNLSTYSLVLLALIPVISLFSPWHLLPVHSFHAEWLAIILGLLAWLLALPLLWRQQTVLIPRLALLPLAFMAFIAVQAQILPLVIIQHAQMAMLYLLWAALLMVLIKLLVDQTNRQYVSAGLAIGLGTAAVCSTLIEFAYRLHGMSGSWGGVAQANIYGDLLALGLASVLYLLAISKANGRIYLLITAAVIILGLSLTPSRSVWLYWLAMLALSSWLQRHLVKFLLSGFGFYLLLQTLWSLDLLPALQSTTSAAEKLYQGIGGAPLRLHIWQVAWQLFTESPWLGQGFGQFDWGYFQAGHHIPELQTRMEHGHNLILHLLAELGVFPVLILLGLLGLWLKTLLTAVSQKRQNDEDKSLPFYSWILMLLAVLGIHSLLEYPLWYAPLLGVAAIILALGESQHWQLRLGTVGSFGVAVLISTGIAIASVHEWHYRQIEKTLNNHIQTNSQQTLDQLFAKSRQAVVQAPLLSPHIAIVFSLSGTLSDEKMRPDLSTLNNASYHFSPYAKLVYQQAELQALNGLNDEARQTMKLALLAYPNEKKQFIEELAILSAGDQKKTAFLRNMAEDSLRKNNQPEIHT